MRMRAEALRSLAFGSIGAGWSAIGTPFNRAIRIIQIWNLTDALLVFSFTGSIDNTSHFVIPAGGFMLLDLCSNKSEDPGFFISINTQMWCKQIGVPTTGSVYVSGFYAAQQK